MPEIINTINIGSLNIEEVILNITSHTLVDGVAFASEPRGIQFLNIAPGREELKSFLGDEHPNIYNAIIAFWGSVPRLSPNPSLEPHHSHDYETEEELPDE